MLAKFAEDDRLEQMNAAKRRMKAAEHQRAVQAMIEERRRLFEEQKGRDEAEVEARWVASRMLWILVSSQLPLLIPRPSVRLSC